MKQILPAFFIVGALMVLAGAVLYITNWYLAPYIYTVGATMVAFAQINTPVQSQSTTVKRLRRQQILAAFLLVFTGALMVFAHGNEWILSLTVAAVLELYTAYRIPQEEGKQ